jgi:uncharacterized protein (DUF3084 family)
MLEQKEAELKDLDAKIQAIQGELKSVQEKMQAMDTEGKAYIQELQTKLQVQDLQFKNGVNILNETVQQRLKIEGQIELLKTMYGESLVESNGVSENVVENSEITEAG